MRYSIDPADTDGGMAAGIVEDRPALNQLHLRTVLRRAIRTGVKVDPQHMLDILDGKAKG